MHRTQSRVPEPAAVPPEDSLVASMFATAVTRHHGNDAPAAEALYRAVLALRPAEAQVAYNLGLLLQQQRRFTEAVAAYRHATALRPDYAEAFCNLGVALADDGQRDEALAAYGAALTHRPGFAMAHCNLGVALKAAGRLDDAVASYHRAIALQPDYDFAFANLAAALLEQGKPEEAAIACRRALELRPDMALAHFNLGTALKNLCSLDDAAAAFRSAIRISPDLVEAHFTLAQTLLLAGELEAGWREYEWRWRLPDYKWLTNIHGAFPQPRWDGSVLAGRTILVYAEQGLGDAIQYVRYVRRVVELGGRVILAVHPPLRNLFACVPDVQLVNLDTVPLPPFDVHSPLLSLPLLFGTTRDDIPAAEHYLTPDPERVARWGRRLPASGPRVGIVWAGNPTQGGDRFRSPRLPAVQALFNVPGVAFVALQVGPGRDDLDARPLPPHVLDLGAEVADLADTAAIMAGLDVVISSCTAPLHLAAAMGVPTWGLIPASPHFAWMLGRADSPWYPTLRLYRQERFGTDWSGVVDEVARDLERLVAESAATRP